jgi:4-amino-4-deoxy-L-arabinose transferase-like glycosyltransferase
MIVQIIGVLIPIFLFCAIAIILWKFFDGKHKRQMAMIEKGFNPEEFQAQKLNLPKQENILSNLKWGILALFAGIGLFTGQQLHSVFGFDEGTAIFGSILITGGLALILFYLIAAKQAREKEKTKE